MVAQPQPVVATTPVATATRRGDDAGDRHNPWRRPGGQTAPATACGLPAGSSHGAPDRDVGSIVVNAALTRVGAPYVGATVGPDSGRLLWPGVWAFRRRHNRAAPRARRWQPVASR